MSDQIEAISSVLNKYLLIGRYEGQDPKKLKNPHAIEFIMAIKYIHAIGLLWNVIRRIKL